MPSFRVDITYERPITFYLEADSQQDIEDFLDDHPDWQPADVYGLIDCVGDEVDVSYEIQPEEVVEPTFRITPKGELLEVGE